ncbi:cadherin-87A-like [Littorina saxatilis]|uniref:Cadherin domain-containing protein n=1 Tax=Littorina saxatilis TaxID=31220 RepID=A0AAN9BVG5_9CAEN
MLFVVSIAVLCALFAPSHQQSNRSPTFTQDLSTLLVSEGLFENTTVGSTIGYISCVDPDGDSIVYYVGGSSSLGINDPFTGEIYLLKQLDREQSVNSLNPNEKPNSVTFQCVDFDSTSRTEISASRTRVDLVITVRDNNDNPPVFSIDNPDGFTFSVKESDPVGTVLTGIISVTDEDIGVNAKLDFLQLFCTADPEPCGTFSLNYTEANEGDYRASIVLRRALDYETRTEYRTALRAVDGRGTNVKNTASTGIRIVIEDSQDTDPVFTNQNLNFNVEEGVPVGQSVQFSLSARDGDRGAKRKIFLEVVDDPNGYTLFNASGAVLADSIRGIYNATLFVKTEIDRENPVVANGYTFMAKATEVTDDGTLTSATATQTFRVNIQDRNDNPPTFTESTYTVTVKEMNRVNASVQIPNLRIEVNDPDEPTNARYKMEIVSQSQSGAFGFTPNSLVSGEQNFYLTVNNFQYMDYETPSYHTQNVQLRAVEYLQNGTRGTKTSTAMVIVTLEDVNDNFPQFSPPDYETSVSENAPNFTSIARVSAVDADTGLNGAIVYRLEDRARSLFYINPTSGVIHLMGRLDYEQQTEYSFLALALDRGGNDSTQASKSSQALVRVRVIDYNDVGPEFTLPTYNARVTENSLQFESTVRVTATDPSDTNITYRIVSGNTNTNSFVLDRVTGVLTLREGLNYENTPEQKGIYRLNIEASDNGNPPETTTSVITVTVVDENNHTPIFMPTQYSKTVSEAEAPGTSVLTVSATDSDFGSNGEITYRIGTGGRDSFEVTRDGIVLISNNPSLDYDEIGNSPITVEIIAVDGGSPQHSATAFMTVTVTDANNKPPRFLDSLYNKIVDESSAVGTSVLRVTATDPDQGSSLQYSISASSIIAINKAGSQVGSVIPYDFRKAFTIDQSSGVISVGFGLDRTYVVEMSFQVMVEDVNQQDGIKRATSRVTITISGKPDTELYFNQPWTKDSQEYSVLLLESSPVGTEIMTLQARDPADDSSVLTDYQEVSGSDLGDYFSIITKTDSRGTTPGVVVLNQQLDYESGDLVHSVTVLARKDSRSVTAKITITVTDFNDNRPEFIPAAYKFNVREGAPVNFNLGTIRAIDRDSSSFGPVEFSLAGGLNKDDFKLYITPNEEGVAQLLVAKELDFETRRLYNIEVIATDNKFGRGSAIRLDSKASITIQVLDENDNTPRFSDRQRSFSVPETARPQTRLGQILANDADFNLNGRIYYSLNATASQSQALRLFGITEQTGILVTRASLRGLSGGYTMNVIARDGGSPPRSSDIPITIKVQGAEDDDGTPQWLSPINLAVVKHLEHDQSRLNVDISAVARTANASIIYSFVPFRNDYRNFFINSGTGSINVTADLDREVQATYTLVIQAMDSKNRTMISRRTLIVELEDADDNDPSFMKSNYTACPEDFKVPTVFTAMDNTPPGEIVAQAVACDPDGPGNNNAYYFIYTGNNLCQQNQSTFRVHLNGSIENLEILDYENQTEYLVCVRVEKSASQTGRKKRAFDKTQMVDTDKVAYIVIQITDINDNGPTFPLDSTTAALETTPSEPTLIQVTANDPDGPVYGRVRYDITDTMYYPPDGNAYSLRGAFAIDSNSGEVTTNLPSYSDFSRGFFRITITAFDVENSKLNDTMIVKVIVYQRSQLLRVVLDKPPSEGQGLAAELIKKLNTAGNPEREFFFKSASEHRTGSNIVATQTDICFVLVENNQATEANRGLQALEAGEFLKILLENDYQMINRGTCYALRSSQDGVKWRDLWWVLVAIAIFIFICVIILIVTVTILYSRYKDLMKAETYMVPQ